MTICTKSCKLMRNIINLCLRHMVCTLCKYVFNVHRFSHVPSPRPLGFVCFFFFFGIIIWSPLKVDSNSNLGSFFYETVYDAASIIDYSKEPLNAGIVDSPPPKQRCWQSLSLSPLKRTSRNCIQSSHSWPGDSIPPQRGLWMDA